MINAGLQWAGTAALITMYILMSFFPELHPWNIVAGCIGGILYFGWSFRTANKPQMIVNMAGILVCIAGLVRAWGPGYIDPEVPHQSGIDREIECRRMLNMEDQ